MKAIVVKCESKWADGRSKQVPLHEFWSQHYFVELEG